MFFLCVIRKRFAHSAIKGVTFLLAIMQLLPQVAYSDDKVLFGDHLKPVVDHLDSVVIDRALTLPKLIDLTMEKYPDCLLYTSDAADE